jgi:predicted permease
MLPISRMTDGPVRVGARPAWDRLALFYADVVEQIEALPGIRRAAVVAAPAAAGREATWFARTGIVPSRNDGSPDWRAIQRRVVTPGYFDVLRLPLVRGRAFTGRDHALEFLRSGKGRRRGVAIVNHAAAQQFWPGEEALGRSLTIEGDSRVDGRVVVGLAGNARDLAPDIEPPPTVYVPFAETPDFGATLIARVEGGAAPVADMRVRLRSTDSSLMIGEIRPLEESYTVALAPRRFITTVLTAFAGFGLLLAGVGLYGLVALSVAQRTREFGVRLALGAPGGDVLRNVLGYGLRLALVGSIVGVACALIVSRLLRNLLYGVSPTDPATIIIVTALLLGVTLLACYVPARRATRVDPLVALRAE